MSEIPEGTLLASGGWKGSKLINSLSENLKVSFREDMKDFDFYVSKELAVIYINEDELLEVERSYRRRLVRCSRVNLRQRKTVIAHVTPLTKDIFHQLQKFASITLVMNVISVSNTEEATQLLIQMSKCEQKKNSNPLRIKLKDDQKPDESLIQILTSIEGVSEKKSLEAMANFRTIANVANSSEEDLTKVFGPSLAIRVYNFFSHKV